MMTDPIADMLTRIRNAVQVERPYVEMPTSKLKEGLAGALKREGYIWDYSVAEQQPRNVLRIDLKYGPNGERVITKLVRESGSGRGSRPYTQLWQWPRISIVVFSVLKFCARVSVESRCSITASWNSVTWPQPSQMVKAVTPDGQQRASLAIIVRLIKTIRPRSKRDGSWPVPKIRILSGVLTVRRYCRRPPTLRNRTTA